MRHPQPMRSEHVPFTPGRERPSQPPRDPPDPGPQAAAWRRALKVVIRTRPH